MFEICNAHPMHGIRALWWRNRQFVAGKPQNDARSTYEVWLGELQERMRQSARAALQAHDLEPESKDGLEVLVVCSSFCGNVEICLYVCSIARPLLTPWRSSRPGRRQAAAGQAAAPKKAGGKDSDCKWASQFIGQRPSSRVAQKRWKPQPVSSQLWGSPAAANFLWDAHSWHSY